MVEPKSGWESALDSVKGAFSGKGAGTWLLGGLAALAGLATGGVSALGFLLAAGLAMLATQFAPKIMEMFSQPASKNTPNASGRSWQAADLQNQSQQAGQTAEMARPLPPQVSIGTPQQESPGVYTMPAEIDGLNYDLRLTTFHDKAKGDIRTSKIEYKQQGEDNYRSAYQPHTAIAVGSINSEDGTVILDNGLLTKMGSDLTEKHIRPESKKAIRAAGLTGALVAGSDAFITRTKGSGSAYVVQKTGDNQITISTLDNVTVGTVALSKAELADFKAKQTQGVAARAIGDRILKWEKEEAGPGEIIPVGDKPAFAAIKPLPDDNSVTLEPHANPGKGVKSDGTFDGTFKIKGDDTVYHYTLGGMTKNNNKFTAQTITLTSEGGEPVFVDKVTSGKSVGEHASDKDADGKYPYKPNDENIGDIITKALKNRDHEQQIDRLLKNVYSAGPAVSPVSDQQRFLFNVDGGGAYDITTTKTTGASGTGYTVDVKDHFTKQSVSVNGNFGSVEHALRAAIRATGEKPGQKGPNIYDNAQDTHQNGVDLQRGTTVYPAATPAVTTPLPDLGAARNV